jgi:type III restriction enzyme
LQTRFRDPDGDYPTYLFPQAQPIVRAWLDGWLDAQGVPKASVLYPDLAELACEKIYLACTRAQPDGGRIKAVLDPYNPKGSTGHVNFTTTKTVYVTDPRKCHVSHVVCDGAAGHWEAEMARVLETHPAVEAYVKNQGLGFEVPYRDGSVARRYQPDFIVRLRPEGAEPLNLVIETKGFRGVDAELKAETMKERWVPGVNNLGGFGRWAFAELRSVHTFEAEFAELVRSFERRLEMA